jgi:hypothetical protein
MIEKVIGFGILCSSQQDEKVDLVPFLAHSTPPSVLCLHLIVSEMHESVQGDPFTFEQ